MESLPPLPFAVLLFITEVSDAHLVLARGINGSWSASSTALTPLAFWLCSSVLSTEAPAQETRGSWRLRGQKPSIAISQCTRWDKLYSLWWCSLFHSKKKLPCCTTQIVMLMYAQPFPPVPISCHWSLITPRLQNFDLILQTSEIFSTINWWCVCFNQTSALCEWSPFPPPLFHAILCYLCLKSFERGKTQQGDIGTSRNFFLTSSPFYTNISRCWSVRCSSCVLGHFKFY